MRGPSLPAVAALALLAALGGPADAHQTSIKYVDVAIEGQRATIQLTVAPGDVTEPLGLPADAQPGVADAVTPGVAAYVARWLAIGPEGGPPCPAAAPPRVRADADARFIIVEWQAVCPVALDRLALDLRAFFAVDPRHEAIVTVHERGAPGDAVVVRASDPVLHVRAGDDLGLGGWVAAGVEHIWAGRDHVGFVLVLLLVVTLVRERGAWTVRAPLATLRSTAAIVTAFTLAHSLSLIAASLGWVSLPGRLVESLIAFSILYTAIENIVKPDVRWRFALTFGFGLMHGLGFAGVLEALLPPDRVVGPLLGFNLGVELGQLAIVAIALPLVWLASHALGPDRYRRWGVPVASSVVAAIAVKWLIERAFEVTLVQRWGM